MNKGKGPEALGAILHQMAGDLLGAEWRVLSHLLAHWPEVAGDLAEHACPSALRLIPNPEGRERARLTIRIPGALAPLYQMQEAQMKARINALLGYAFIETIVFEHRLGGSAPPRESPGNPGA